MSTSSFGGKMVNLSAVLAAPCVGWVRWILAHPVVVSGEPSMSRTCQRTRVVLVLSVLVLALAVIAVAHRRRRNAMSQGQRRRPPHVHFGW